MQDTSYDAIVVGSGISGGWAAKELTEKGLRVLLLERGRNVEHIKDYVNAAKAPWEYPHRGGRTHAMEEAYPVLKRDYPLNEKNLAFWASDKDSPYTEVKRFDWYRGYQVGGRSLLWGRQSYRWSDIDFEGNAKDGIAIDWPIRYADISPWYDHVEPHAGISGSLEGLPQLPDGKFQPAMPLNCGEELIAGKLKKLYQGRRRIIPGRTANLTKELTGRAACQYRNACWLGCPYGAYFSTQSSTLPAAAKTGRLTLRPFAIATEVIFDRDRKRAKGVRVLDAVTNQTTEYTAKIVFLCASTLNSAWLLMRSLETLELRCSRSVDNARHVATYLRVHPKVERVYFLDFLSAGSAEADIYRRQCRAPGATFSFTVRGGEAEAFRFLDAMRLVKLAVSLGGTESLASHPAAMTHSDIPRERQAELGIAPNLIRVSIGVENADDLVADFRQALEQV